MDLGEMRSEEIDNPRSGKYNVSQYKTGKGKNGGNNNDKNKPKGPILSATVDGKKVESRSYPRHEWSKLTQAQRNKVKELNKQRRDNSGQNQNNTISSVSREGIRDDMTTLANAIIAGVQRGSGEQEDAISEINTSASTSNNDSTGKRSAPAGSVGNIFGKRKKKE